VDVSDQRQEMGIADDRDPLKWALEEGTGALVRAIESFGVGVEEVGEFLAGRFTGRRILDTDQQVKVVFEQAVCIGLGDRGDMPGVKL